MAKSKTKLQDEAFMREALQLAAKGSGKVSPNPMVGAVVVKGGKIVGRGYHRRYGQKHAEPHALRDAGAAAKGATLYVTLEPCNHTGKQPPCTHAVLEAGIKRLVYACPDTNPVSGPGNRWLCKQGVVVDGPVLKSAAYALNAPFFKHVTTGLPYVIAKWAMTADGKLATSTGSSQWITGPEARKVGHQVRGQVDAILVGPGTVEADDPSLTARVGGATHPIRVVLDRGLSLPLKKKIFRDDSAPTWVICQASHKMHWAKRKAALESRDHIQVITPRAWKASSILRTLGSHGVQSVMVEGGAGILGMFIDEGTVDEVMAYMAPKIVGGAAALSPVGGKGIRSMNDAIDLSLAQYECLGQDVLLRGYTSPDWQWIRPVKGLSVPADFAPILP